MFTLRQGTHKDNGPLPSNAYVLKHAVSKYASRLIGRGWWLETCLQGKAPTKKAGGSLTTPDVSKHAVSKQASRLVGRGWWLETCLQGKAPTKKAGGSSVAPDSVAVFESASWKR
jgi:hypothetical protein